MLLGRLDAWEIVVVGSGWGTSSSEDLSCLEDVDDRDWTLGFESPAGTSSPYLLPSSEALKNGSHFCQVLVSQRSAVLLAS